MSGWLTVCLWLVKRWSCWLFVELTSLVAWGRLRLFDVLVYLLGAVIHLGFIGVNTAERLSIARTRALNATVQTVFLSVLAERWAFLTNPGSQGCVLEHSRTQLHGPPPWQRGDVMDIPACACPCLSVCLQAAVSTGMRIHRLPPLASGDLLVFLICGCVCFCVCVCVCVWWFNGDHH